MCDENYTYVVLMFACSLIWVTKPFFDITLQENLSMQRCPHFGSLPLNGALMNSTLVIIETHLWHPGWQNEPKSRAGNFRRASRGTSGRAHALERARSQGVKAPSGLNVLVSLRSCPIVCSPLLLINLSNQEELLV